MLAAPSVVAADALPPPDPSATCAPGEYASANHCGTTCGYNPCGEGLPDCLPGTRCEPVRRCIETLFCGRRSTPHANSRGPCDDAGGCAVGECQTLQLCIGEPIPDAGPPDAGAVLDAGPAEVVRYGCGCRVGGSPSPALGWLGLALLGLVVTRRGR